MNTDTEIGTMRSLAVAGRALVHAAISAADLHLARYVSRDGRRAAVVLPAGPEDQVPNRAERDALSAHLMGRYRPAFKPDAGIGEADLLGRWLGEFCDSGADVLAVAEAALTGQNMHGTAARVRELRESLERGEAP